MTYKVLVSTVAASTLTSPGSPQVQSAPPDPLASLAPLIGRWLGTSEGQPGKGDVECEYTRILGSRFVEAHNRSVYTPEEKSPKGVEHEDLGIYSFDASRRRIVFRQFHVDGFVNQYVQDATNKPNILVFTSEAIENIPPGRRARETLTLHGADELEEVFEVAEPGKEFDLYLRSRMKRAR